MADDDKAPASTPWFRLSVGDRGEPECESPSPKESRGHRELVRNLLGVTELDELAEIERQLQGAISGVPRPDSAWGFSVSGAWGFTFRLDGTVVVWTDYDSETDGRGNLFPPGGLRYELLRADFVALFRAWAASVRHYRSLGGYGPTPPPREMWPKAYPPDTTG